MTGILEKVRPFGYTPLISEMRNEVLKYNFRGISRLVVDKSGHGNNGKLMPKEDPPRRKIVSWFPFEEVLVFDGENDFVEVPDIELDGAFTIDVEFKTLLSRGEHRALFGSRYGWGRREEEHALDFRLGYGQNLQVIVKDESAGVGGYVTYEEDVSDGTKHRGTATYENGTLALYLDKDEVGSASVGPGGSWTTGFAVGKLIPELYYYEGSISRVSVYKEKTIPWG